MENHFEETIKKLEQLEEKRKKAFRKNLPSYIWLVIKNLFVLLVIIGVLNFASTYFETVIFSLIILVYVSIEGFFSNYGYKTMQTTFALANELSQIKRLLKYQENDLEKEKQEKAALIGFI